MAKTFLVWVTIAGGIVMEEILMGSVGIASTPLNRSTVARCWKVGDKFGP